MQKSKYLILTFLFILNHMQSFSQDWKVSNIVDGNFISPNESVSDIDGNMYIISDFLDSVVIDESTTIYSLGDRDIILTKFDKNSNLLWYKTIGSSKRELSGGVDIAPNGNIYISGSFKDSCYFSPTDTLVSTGLFDAFVAVYNENGSLINYKNIGRSSGNQYSRDIKADNDGNILVCGNFVDSLIISNGITSDTLVSPSGYAGYSCKLSGSLSLIWAESYLTNSSVTKLDKIFVSSNEYYFGGTFRNGIGFSGMDTLVSLGSSDIFLLKTNLNGSFEWVRRLGGSGIEALFNLKADEYENIYFLGNYDSPSLSIDSTSSQTATVNINNGGKDIVIAKYNRSGTLLWHIEKGSSNDDTYYDLAIKGDVIYAVGLFSNQIVFNNDTLNSLGGFDGFLAAFNKIGDPIAGVSVRGITGDENCNLVEIDDNLDAYVSGYFESSQITIGDSTFYNTTGGSRNLFFARYSHPFEATITDEEYITCADSSNGMLTVTPYFGVPPYSYSWTKDGFPIAETDSVASGLFAGLYAVSITDDRDSVATAQVQLNNPSPINIGYSVTDVSCNNGINGSIDLTVTGGNNNYEYNWAGGTGLNPTEEDQGGLTAAGYSVTVTDIKGCTGTETIIVGQPDPIVFGETEIIETNSDVDTGRIYLVLSGGTEPYTTFSWEGPEGYTSSEDTITNLDGGNYTVTVTDANSCLADTTFLVPNDSLFIGYMLEIQNVSCGDLTDGQASVSSNRHPFSSNFKYIWIDLEDSVQVGGNFAGISGLDSSLYRVYIIDADKVDTTFVEFEITKPQVLNAASIASNPTCSGNSNGFINAIISGGTLPYSYEWSNASTNEDLTGIQANGTYSLTVTDANSCTAFTEETLDDPDVLAVSINKVDPLCRDELSGEATADVTGGVFPYNYAWDDPGSQTEQTASGLEAGSYTVTVTDQNGCTKTSSVSLINPLPISIISIDSTDVSCYGANDGWIKITPTGGWGSYTYNWSHIGLGADSVGSLSPDEYYVTVNDVNDCTPIVDTITINEPTEIVFDIDTTDVSCQGFANGAIIVNVTGGSGSYTYSWGHTGLNLSELGGLSGGTYNLTVSDGSCPDYTFNIPVNEPEEFIVTTNKENLSCFEAGDGSIQLEITGGSESYEINWGHTGDKAVLLENLSAGNYKVTVDDGNCPVKNFSVDVTEPGEFLISGFDTTNLSAIGALDGEITIHVTGGTAPFRYAINGSTLQLDSVFSNLDAGKYEIAVNDVNNCGPIYSDSIEINEPSSGIKNYWNESSISFYPNPADDWVTVQFNKMEKDKIELKILNAMGSLVHRQPVLLSYNQKNIEVETGSLSPGIYFVLIDGKRLKNPLVIK